MHSLKFNVCGVTCIVTYFVKLWVYYITFIRFCVYLKLQQPEPGVTVLRNDFLIVTSSKTLANMVETKTRMLFLCFFKSKYNKSKFKMMSMLREFKKKANTYAFLKKRETKKIKQIIKCYCLYFFLFVCFKKFQFFV